MKFAGNMKATSESEVKVSHIEASTPPKAPQAAGSEACQLKYACESRNAGAGEIAQMAFEKESFAKIDAIVTRDTKGVNPIKIYIPESGRIYRFSKLFVIDQNPTIVASLYEGWIYKVVLYLVFGVVLSAAIAVAHMAGRKIQVAFALGYLALLFIVRPFTGELFGYGILLFLIGFGAWLWKSYSQRIIEGASALSWKKDIAPTGK